MSGHGYNELEFETVETMSKEEAISEIKKYFKGNKKFIELACMMVYSTGKFEKIHRLNYYQDTYDWEKLLGVCIDTEWGFKHFYYRKGNQKYKPGNTRTAGNKTYDIDEYRTTIYFSKTGEVEEFTF